MKRITLAIILALTANSPSASQITELPLEQRVAASELVIIGKVSRIKEGSGIQLYDLAEVTPKTILKGEITGTINVAFNSGLYEENGDCCEAGETYILFLSKSPSGNFHTVNSPYGSYKVPR